MKFCKIHTSISLPMEVLLIYYVFFCYCFSVFFSTGNENDSVFPHSAALLSFQQTTPQHIIRITAFPFLEFLNLVYTLNRPLLNFLKVQRSISQKIYFHWSFSWKISWPTGVNFQFKNLFFQNKISLNIFDTKVSGFPPNQSGQLFQKNLTTENWPLELFLSHTLNVLTKIRSEMSRPVDGNMQKWPLFCA